MTKKQKDQQEAIWELLSTEAAYIAKLHVIKKVGFSVCGVCVPFYFVSIYSCVSFLVLFTAKKGEYSINRKIEGGIIYRKYLIQIGKFVCTNFFLTAFCPVPPKFAG